MKKCTKCGQSKTLLEFYKNRSTKDGYMPICKSCRNRYLKKYRKENKEKISVYHKRWVSKNKERLADYYKNYRKENKERLATNHKVWTQKNKDYSAKYKKMWHDKKNSEQPGCIYQIINLTNDKIYIGETTRGIRRWSEHLNRLRRGDHKNRELQLDFDKYGEQMFRWSILKEGPKDKQWLLLEEAKTIHCFIEEGKGMYNLSLTIDQLKMLSQENKT